MCSQVIAEDSHCIQYASDNVSKRKTRFERLVSAKLVLSKMKGKNIVKNTGR